MKNKYQQVSNDTDWGSSEVVDSGAETETTTGYSSGTGKGAAGKGKRKKRKGAAGKSIEAGEGGVEPVDEAGKSYSLAGIEERMQRVKAELMERNRATMEARRHMRADYRAERGRTGQGKEGRERHERRVGDD